ncbi:hypothetical protein ACFLU5_17605, partial [Bacteroidota bacterium]
FKAISLLKYRRIQEMEKKVQRLGDLEISHPDLLMDCFWGNPTKSHLLYILENLPNGTSELILHIGTDARQENYPSGLDLDYFENRELELATVTGGYLKELLLKLNIKTVGFSEILK